MRFRFAAALFVAASFAAGTISSAQTAPPSTGTTPAKPHPSGKPNPHPSAGHRPYPGSSPGYYPVINIDSKTMHQLMNTTTPVPRASNKITRKITGQPTPTIFKSIGTGN